MNWGRDGASSAKPIVDQLDVGNLSHVDVVGKIKQVQHPQCLPITRLHERGGVGEVSLALQDSVAIHQEEVGKEGVGRFGGKAPVDSEGRWVYGRRRGQQR